MYDDKDLSVLPEITCSFTHPHEDLDYVDDIFFLSHKLVDIQAKANELENRAKAVALIIIAYNIKVMRINNSKPGSISGKHVEFDDSFTIIRTNIIS